MVAEGLVPGRWGNGPRYIYRWHTHVTDKVLYCASGSITFHLHQGGDGVDPTQANQSGDIAMGPGDRLDLPAGTEHSATVGKTGVRCVEAMIRRDK